MRLWILAASTSALAIAHSAHADVCDQLAQQAQFDELESVSSAFNEHAFHQAMCDKEIQVTEQQSAGGGGLSFAIEGVPIGFSAKAASEYRSNYQKLFCTTSSARNVSDARKYIRSKTVSPAWATAIDNCTKSRAADLVFHILTHPANANIAIMKFSYQPSVQPKNNAAFRKLEIAPAGAIKCVGAPKPDSLLTWRDWYSLSCEREAGRNEGAVVSVVTSVGTFDFLFPEAAPQPAIEAVKKDLAKVRLAVAALESKRLQCKVLEVSGVKAAYSDATVAITDADIKDGWFRTGGGCHLPTGGEAGIASGHNPILLDSEPTGEAGWYCRAGDQAYVPTPIVTEAFLIACRL